MKNKISLQRKHTVCMLLPFGSDAVYKVEEKNVHGRQKLVFKTSKNSTYITLEFWFDEQRGKLFYTGKRWQLQNTLHMPDEIEGRVWDVPVALRYDYLGNRVPQLQVLKNTLNFYVIGDFTPFWCKEYGCVPDTFRMSRIYH